MNIRKIVQSGAAAAMIALCSWLALPLGELSFTLQTFAVALSLLLLGGKWGLTAVGVYLLLGACGLPVFAGLRGGLGVLLGATGGYLWGFLAFAGLYWLWGGFGSRGRLWGLVLGLLGCYCCGTVWYCYGYLGGAGLAGVLAQCVVPYLLPDAIKLALAWMLAKKLSRFVY